MDSPTVIPFPRDPDAPTDADKKTLLEINAAILMVATGKARRVVLAALPFVDRVAGIGAAHAGVANVRFRVEAIGPTGGLTVTVGPRE